MRNPLKTIKKQTFFIRFRAGFGFWQCPPKNMKMRKNTHYSCIFATFNHFLRCVIAFNFFFEMWKALHRNRVGGLEDRILGRNAALHALEKKTSSLINDLFKKNTHQLQKN